MPKKLFGCVNCFNETIELKLVKMEPSKMDPKNILLTYQCPDCGHEEYKIQKKNETIPFPDEVLPAGDARQARQRYIAKRKIYEAIKNETDEEKIRKLKQDPYYDPEFDPSVEELY